MNIFCKDMGPMLTGRIAIDDNGRTMFWKNRKITPEEIINSCEYKEEFHVDENALFWYKKFLSLAKENNIKIVIFNTPSLYEIFKKWESGGMNKEYRMAMYELKNSYDNINLIEPLCESYDRKYFFNVSHLNDAGHDLFSSELAKRIIDQFYLPSQK